MNVEARILAELSEFEYASGEKISNKLNITRSAVWKHIKKLRERGYDIKATPRNGYILVARPDKLISAELQTRLHTDIIGSHIIHYDEIGSTADAARVYAARGVPDGTVLIAESQSAGKGRMGREWVTPRGEAIALSVIVYPEFPPPVVPMAGLATSLAARNAIERTTGLKPVLKWPNDIYLEGAKAGGVLLEMAAELDRVRWVVISVGINVNNSFKGTGLEGIATSLREVAGRKLSRLDITVALLEELDRAYTTGMKGRAMAKVRQAFEEADMLQGRHVEVRTPSGIVKGTAAGIDADGRLQVRGDDGELHSLFSGEATLS